MAPWQPNMPILVANDSRLLPQTFEGGTITSKEIDNVTFNVGQLEHAEGRAGFQQHWPGRGWRYSGQQPVPLRRC